MSTEIKTKSVTKTVLKKPSKYAIMLLNDDYSTFEFVMFILRKVFNCNHDESFLITTEIHEKGSKVIGSFNKQIAESKVHQIYELAEMNKMPLKAKIKKID